MTTMTFTTKEIPAQKAFMESKAPELLYSGAFGAGKSRVGLEKGQFLSFRYPGNVGVVLRKTFTSLRYTTMETFFRVVIPQDLLSQCDFNKVTNILTYPNGSKIFFMGIDEPLKIGGLEVGWAFVDEVVELSEEDYMMVLGRVRLSKLPDGSNLPFRQVMAATNPGPESHWLYKRAFLDKLVDVVESSTLDNPFLPDDYKRSLQSFTGRYYERFVLGKWVGFEGLVYDNFDPRIHMVDGFELPGDWQHYRSIDFGFTNPFCCLWAAQCPEVKEVDYQERGWKGLYIYRQVYMSQRTIDAHARDLMKYEESIVTTVCDWDAGDRAILDRNGIPSIKANKDISSGIQEVYKLLGGGRIHIFKNCLVEVDNELVKAGSPTSLEQEFGSYRWANMPSNKNQKEVPRDKDNHGMDALRYLVATLFARVRMPVLYKREGSPILGRQAVRNWGSFRDKGSWMKVKG